MYIHGISFGTLLFPTLPKKMCCSLQLDIYMYHASSYDTGLCRKLGRSNMPCTGVTIMTCYATPVSRVIPGGRGGGYYVSTAACNNTRCRKKYTLNACACSNAFVLWWVS